MKHSEKTKKKMIESAKGKEWIHNLKLKQRKRLKKKEIKAFINQGWIIGRGPNKWKLQLQLLDKKENEDDNSNNNK